jgi:hypothetical protein
MVRFLATRFLRKWVERPLALEMAEYASCIGFKYLVGHCYERDEPFLYLPFVETLESGLAQAQA